MTINHMTINRQSKIVLHSAFPFGEKQLLQKRESGLSMVAPASAAAPAKAPAPASAAAPAKAPAPAPAKAFATTCAAAFVALFAVAFAIAIVCACAIPAHTAWAAPGDWGGTGQQNDPYTISDAAGLKKLSTLVNTNAGEVSDEETQNEFYVYEDTYFTLTKDITLSGEWEPIGGVLGDVSLASYYFAGHFDGAGHTISGLQINAQSGNYYGLFGLVGGASPQNPASVSQLRVQGSVNVSNGSFDTYYRSYFVGGIVGAASWANLSGLRNEVSVNAASATTYTDDVGGVVGWLMGGMISNCVNTAPVSGSTLVGGIVGYLQPYPGMDSGLQNCRNTGALTAYEEKAGGLAGQLVTQSEANTLAVDHNYSTALITYAGDDPFPYIGALFGMTGNAAANATSQHISACYALQGSYAVLYGESKLDLDSSVAFKNASTFTSPEFAALLGAGFKAVQDAYPVLAWETQGEPIITVQPIAEASYLAGTPADELVVGATLPAGYDGTTAAYLVRYQWYTSTDADLPLAQWQAVLGGVTQAYTPSTSEIGTTYYYCRVYNNDGGAVCSTVSAITVYSEAASVPREVTIGSGTPADYTQPISITVDEGQSFVLTAFATAAHDEDGLLYQWYVCANDATEFTPLAGATEQTLTVTPAYSGSFQYKCAVRAWHQAPGNVSDAVETPVASVTVNLLAIRTARDLVRFATLVNNGRDFAGVTVRMEQDIDLSSLGAEDSSAQERAFVPIGTRDNPFAGTFDGQGHAIRGLALEAQDAAGTGLFGNVIGVDGRAAVVKNVVVSGTVTASSEGTAKANVAGVAGYATYAHFLNVGNEADVTNNAAGKDVRGTGGVVGTAEGHILIAGCYNKGAIVSQGSEAGGLVGYLVYPVKMGTTQSSLSYSYNAGSVSAPAASGDTSNLGRAGGLIGCVVGTTGASYAVSLKNSYNAAAVSGVYADPNSGKGAGALVGTYSSSSFLTLTCSACYYDSDITGVGAARNQTYTGVTARTTTQMRAAASLLNNPAASDTTQAFKANDSITSGYPVLAWEEARWADAPRITQQPESLQVEQGVQGLQAQVSLQATNAQGGHAGLTYRWERSTDASMANAETLSSEGPTCAVDTVYVGRWYYRCTVASVGLEVHSAIATVVVYKAVPAPTNAGITDDAGVSYAEGDLFTAKQFTVRTLTASAENGGEGTLSYAWYATTYPTKDEFSPSYYALIADTARCTVDTSALNVTRPYYYCVITNTANVAEGTETTSSAGNAGASRSASTAGSAGATGSTGSAGAKTVVVGPVRVQVSEFTLDSADDVADFASAVNAGTTFNGLTVRMTADIDMDTLSAGKSFAPIGKDTNKNFQGTLDGQGHTITLHLNQNAANTGLFGLICKSATICNLVVAGSVTSTNQTDPAVGALVAQASMNTNSILTLSNVGNKAAVASTSSSGTAQSAAAGLVGRASGYGEIIIEDSYNQGTINAKGLYNAGGLVGTASMNGGSIAFSSCYNAGTVETIHDSGRSGGLVGNAGSSEIAFSNCFGMDTASVAHNDSSVESSSAKAGVLVGTASSLDKLTFTDCFFQQVSSITGHASVGGFARPSGVQPIEDMTTLAFVDTLNAVADKWISGTAVTSADKPERPALYWEGAREAVPPVALDRLSYTGDRVIGIKGGRGYVLSDAGSASTLYLVSGDACGMMPGVYHVTATLQNGFSWQGLSGTAATQPLSLSFEIGKMRVALPTGLDLPYTGEEQYGLDTPAKTGLIANGARAVLPGSYTAQLSISDTGATYYEWADATLQQPVSVPWSIHSLDLSSEVNIRNFENDYDTIEEAFEALTTLQVVVTQTGTQLHPGSVADDEFGQEVPCEYESSIVPVEGKRGHYLLNVEPVKGNTNIVGIYQQPFTVGNPIDSTELEQAVAQAQTLLNACHLSEDGSDVPADEYWFTEDEWNDTVYWLEYYIDRAQAGIDAGDLSEDDVALFLDMLANATKAVNKEIQKGTHAGTKPGTGKTDTGSGTADDTSSHGNITIAPPVKVGSTYTVAGMGYKVTKAASASAPGEVAFTKAKNASKVTIPASVKLSDAKTYNVTSVNTKAFNNLKKVKTVVVGKNITKINKSAFFKTPKLKKITIKTTQLKKASVKQALKGSKIKAKKLTIKVPKKLKKTYKKAFTKANLKSPKKVVVK